MPSKIGLMLSAPYGVLQVTETDTDETASTMLEQLRTVENSRFIKVPGEVFHFSKLNTATHRRRKVTLRLRESPTIYLTWGEWKGLHQRLIDEAVKDEESGSHRDSDNVDRVVLPPVRPAVPRILLSGEWLICWSRLQVFFAHTPFRRRRRGRAHIAEAQKEELL